MVTFFGILTDTSTKFVPIFFLTARWEKGHLNVITVGNLRTTRVFAPNNPDIITVPIPPFISLLAHIPPVKIPAFFGEIKTSATV